jgi:hypothetical protein
MIGEFSDAVGIVCHSIQNVIGRKSAAGETDYNIDFTAQGMSALLIKASRSNQLIKIPRLFYFSNCCFVYQSKAVSYVTTQRSTLFFGCSFTGNYDVVKTVKVSVKALL